jgi:chloramphenicol 3-O-phosphotransferase
MMKELENHLEGVVIEITSGELEDAGRTYTVYGIRVSMANGEEYRYDDVSFDRGEVVKLADRLRANEFLFEELPYLVEDHISELSEYAV